MVKKIVENVVGFIVDAIEYIFMGAIAGVFTVLLTIKIAPATLSCGIGLFALCLFLGAIITVGFGAIIEDNDYIKVANKGMFAAVSMFILALILH